MPMQYPHYPRPKLADGNPFVAQHSVNTTLYIHTGTTATDCQGSQLCPAHKRAGAVHAGEAHLWPVQGRPIEVGVDDATQPTQLGWRVENGDSARLEAVFVYVW